MTRKNSTALTALIFTFLCIAISPTINAMNIVNTLWPYDTLIRPTCTNKYRFQLAGYVETGVHNAVGYNNDGEHVNALRIWNCQQNSIAMLEGFERDTDKAQLRAALLDSDNGIRGRFLFDGNLKLNYNISFAARFFFANDWSLGIYLPFYRMQLKDVTIQDLTPNLDNDDKLVKQLLTNDFAAHVKELGDLCLGDWTRQGPGDLAFIIDWFRDFYQNKPFLKCVRVNWRWGITMPTGVRENTDLIFAVPFGYDGAFAMPFGLGLDLTLGSHFKTGVDVQLTQIFGNQRNWRIKTQINQTELLLLQKAHGYKDYGLVQRFNLYVELYQIIKGLSLTAGYQFLKQGDTTLSLTNQEFSSAVANTSRQLDEFTMHHGIFKATYDFGVHRVDPRVRPEWSIYARIPFNGRNSALIPVVGTVFSVDF
jgi:hypothetical protein